MVGAKKQKLAKERANRPNYPAFVAPEHGQGSVIYLCLCRDASSARGRRHHGTALFCVGGAHSRIIYYNH